jgi:anti-anti-sigma factor
MISRRSKAAGKENKHMLTVTVENLNEAVVLRCAGRIVRGYETALLCTASRQHGRTVIVDLENVDAIDAAGIGSLVSLQAAGTYLRLMNPNDQVREVLRVTGLDSIFEIAVSEPGRKMPAGSAAQDVGASEVRGFAVTAI